MRNINHITVPVLTSHDCSAVLIQNGESHIVLASFYFDITHKIEDHPSLKKILKFAKDKKIPLLIGTDTNAHSGLWYSPSNNPRGDTFEDIILSNDLFVLNNNSAFTFVSGRGMSHIDVTLTNTLGYNLVQNW